MWRDRTARGYNLLHIFSCIEYNRIIRKKVISIIGYIFVLKNMKKRLRFIYIPTATCIIQALSPLHQTHGYINSNLIQLECLDVALWVRLQTRCH